MRRSRAWLLTAVLVVAVAAAGMAGTALASISIWPPVEWTFEANGGFRPKTLPKKGPIPISAFLSGKVESKTGAIPPSLKTLEQMGDKHVAVDAQGLPACGRADLQSANAVQARKACGRALLGSGEAEILLAYPENSPIPLRTKLLVVNGGFRVGVTTLFIHAYITVPTPKPLVTTVKIKKTDDGRYGSRATASFPRIGDGYGLIKSFSLNIKKGILTATCPTNELLQTRVEPSFADGTELSGTLLSPCTPKD